MRNSGPFASRMPPSIGVVLILTGFIGAVDLLEALLIGKYETTVTVTLLSTLAVLVMSSIVGVQINRLVEMQVVRAAGEAQAEAIAFLAEEMSHFVNNPLQILRSGLERLRHHSTEADALSLIGQMEEATGRIAEFIAGVASRARPDLYQQAIQRRIESMQENPAASSE